MTRKLTDQQKIDIKHKYLNDLSINCADLGREYKVSKESISALLKYRGVKIRQIQGICNRKYSIDDTFFEKIDTEAKAYFLGLLYADGWNSDGEIGIGLQERDKDILIKFKNELKYEGPLNFMKKSKYNPNWSDAWRLTITHRKMSNDLIKLGVVENKSLVLKFPTKNQVPNHLIHHFLRGMLDGDGHITSYGGSSLISSIPFIEKLEAILKGMKIDFKVIYVAKANKILSITKKQYSIKFLDWLYKEATIYLERKYNQYISINRLTYFKHDNSDGKKTLIRQSYSPNPRSSSNSSSLINGPLKE